MSSKIVLPIRQFKIRCDDGSYIGNGGNGIQFFTKEEAEHKLDWLENNDKRGNKYFMVFEPND